MTKSASGSRVSWRRIVYALAMIFGIAVLLEVWFGPFFAARSIGADSEMNVVPNALFDSSLSGSSKLRVERRGVSFEPPWSETEQVKEAPAEGMLTFTNGLGLYVYDPSLQTKNLEFLRRITGVRAAALRHEFRRETLSSEFAFWSAAMRTTRDDAKWWRSPIYNTKVAYLLTIKMTAGPSPSEGSTPIYEMKFGEIRGFQMGDPQGTHGLVQLVLFDQMDHQCRIDLINTTHVKQSEINALVSSLRFEPTKR